MKFSIVFLAAMTVALLQQPAYSFFLHQQRPYYTRPFEIQQETQESTKPVVIPNSMLEYGNQINRGFYGRITHGTLLYNGVRLPVTIKKDRLAGRLMHGVSSELDALR